MLLFPPPTTTKFRPPKGIKLVKGLNYVRTIEEPQFARTHGNVKGNKRKGLLYQERVVNELDLILPSKWEAVPGLWFEFTDASGHRYAQTDWIGFDWNRGLICIAEIKLSRVPQAWWQLNRLYRPLIEKLFPQFEVAMLEIASNVQPIATPDEVKVVRSLEQVVPWKTCFMRMDYAELR